jgi:signal transduction histidine kinase
MKKFAYGLTSIRFQLTIVVLVATIPMMVFVGLFANQQRKEQSVEVEKQMLFSAKTAAMGYDQIVSFTRQVMGTIAELPSLKRNDYTACTKELDQIRQNYSIYRGISVNSADGTLLCSSPQLDPNTPINQSSQDWFQRAVEQKDFAIGSYSIEPVSKQGNLTFGFPVLAPDGEIQYVIGIAVNIDTLNESASRLALPDGAVLRVIDRNGTIILRIPDPELWVGKEDPDFELLSVAQNQDEGITQGVGLDQLLRVYGYTTLPSDPHKQLLVAVGIPVNQAYQDINTNLLRNLIAIGSLALIGIILAWTITERYILRPAQTLTAAARRLTAGDLTARTHLDQGSGELFELARAFDQMADSLQEQETQLRTLNQELEERVNQRTAELKQSRDFLQQFSNHLQNVLEEERKKISREIHDELGQALTGLKMDLRTISKQIRPDQEAIHQRITGSIQLIDSTIVTMRRISSDLRPGILDDLGLVAAVDWLVTNFQNRSDIQVNLEVDPPDLEVPKELHTGLFRIIQEGLTNVMRHSKATEVWITINGEPDQLQIEVRDNGRGFDPKILKETRSLGLIGIRERALLIGGEAKIEGNPGKGTRIEICIPMTPVRGEI